MEIFGATGIDTMINYCKFYYKSVKTSGIEIINSLPSSINENEFLIRMIIEIKEKYTHIPALIKLLKNYTDMDIYVNINRYPYLYNFLIFDEYIDLSIYFIQL
jgi:hypothetical protein